MDIPGRLKKALFEKGWTQKRLCQELKVTENGLRHMVDNNTWKLETIDKIASLLDLPLTYFVSESEMSLDTLKEQSNKIGFGEQVIAKMAGDIDSIKAIFEEQLRTKDQQIAGLQRMLESVLGKSEGVTGEPLSTEEFSKIMRIYRKRMLKRVLPQQAPSPTQPAVKLVALG